MAFITGSLMEETFEAASFTVPPPVRRLASPDIKPSWEALLSVRIRMGLNPSLPVIPWTPADAAPNASIPRTLFAGDSAVKSPVSFEIMELLVSSACE